MAQYTLRDLRDDADRLGLRSHAGPVDISHAAAHGVQGRAVLIDLEAHLGRTALGSTPGLGGCTVGREAGRRRTSETRRCGCVHDRRCARSGGRGTCRQWS